MSQRTRAVANFRAPAIMSGHASNTKDNRKGLVTRLVNMMWAMGIKIRSPRELTREHVILYVATRVKLKAKPRSIHNGLSAIRRTLAFSNRKKFAESPAMLSPALGCPPGSRDGTNVAIPAAQYDDLLVRASRLDSGLVCALRLERTIGLRRKEALMSYPSLALWESQLLNGEPLLVTRGTKNNRPRLVHIPDVDAALDAVRAAMVIGKGRDGVLLIGTLEQVIARYGYFMGKRRLGVKGHALRYAFAHERYLRYRAEGMDLKQAVGRTTEDLGHGEQRQGWSLRVYLLGILPRQSAKAKERERARKAKAKAKAKEKAKAAKAKAKAKARAMAAKARVRARQKKNAAKVKLKVGSKRCATFLR